MSDTVLKIENLSKQYRLGSIGTGTLSHDFNRWVHKIKGKDDPYLKIGETNNRETKGNSDYAWALRDINFEVKKGEVLGIIGKNGAGKSTLLKILSKVTGPTTGRLRAKGRIASLLEVGTGFHPELTGRENIFLNGAILGMNRQEIKRKFDEIVSFSGVERYIDTPVKRYSSGMYVRLAFAVAAHLDSEILIVDEVLAVGDLEFQKKCLGKMEDIGKAGNTVLFVSHDLGAIQNLCTRALLLDKGTIILDSSVNEVIDKYSFLDIENSAEKYWEDQESAPSFKDNHVKLSFIKSIDKNGQVKAFFDVKEPVVIEVGYHVLKEKYCLNIHLYIKNGLGQTIVVAMDNIDSPWKGKVHPTGRFSAKCTIPKNFLNEGLFKIEYLICTHPHDGTHVTVDDVITFNIIDDMKENGVRGNWGVAWPNSFIRTPFVWEFNQEDN